MRPLQRRSSPARQRGAAILLAMLTVVLVATLATSVLWQQWRGVEVEAAERARTQASWILSGALDWARLILREDARKGGADHLGEPWAVPLEAARLSTFLAAERGEALVDDGAQDIFLSGQIVDVQARLNVTNLVQDGKIHEPSRIAFARLFELLNLPEAELQTLAERLRQAQAGASGPADSGNAPLWPQDPEQLSWVGLSAASLATLRPFVCVLPVPTPVNLNTAPVEVVYASVTALELADAHRLVRLRDTTPLTSLNDASQAASNAAAQFNDAQHSLSSRFFEVRGALRQDQATVQEYSLVQRDGLEVKTLWRRRAVAPPGDPYNERHP